MNAVGGCKCFVVEDYRFRRRGTEDLGVGSAAGQVKGSLRQPVRHRKLEVCDAYAATLEFRDGIPYKAKIRAQPIHIGGLAVLIVKLLRTQLREARRRGRRTGSA
jgi:hypothetical protein